jgi:hypothetical protein
MVRFRLPLFGALLGALLLAGPAAADNPRQSLIASKAPGVVSVKITAKISGSFGEQAVDQEQNRTTSGVVVDAAGLVLVPADAVAMPRRFGRMGMNIKLTPTSIRVIFPGDETEYEAILGATDTKLGLAYVLIRDLKGRKAEPLDMSKSVEPAVGDTLYAVTRLGQGFDYAPVCQTASVVGQVSKPRQMWVIDGDAVEEGHPLYNAAGLLAGVMVSQEGVGEGGGTLVFLLPLKTAAPSFERGMKAAQKELEDLKVREAEAAAKAAEQPADPAPAEPAPAEPAPAEPEQPK